MNFHIVSAGQPIIRGRDDQLRRVLINAQIAAPLLVVQKKTLYE